MMEEVTARLYEECYSIMVAYLMREYRFTQDDAQEIASQAILEDISPGVVSLILREMFH